MKQLVVPQVTSITNDIILLQTKFLLLLLTEVHKLFLDYFTSGKIHRNINNFILTIQQNTKFLC